LNNTDRNIAGTAIATSTSSACWQMTKQSFKLLSLLASVNKTKLRTLNGEAKDNLIKPTANECPEQQQKQ